MCKIVVQTKDQFLVSDGELEGSAAPPERPSRNRFSPSPMKMWLTEARGSSTGVS